MLRMDYLDMCHNLRALRSRFVHLNDLVPAELRDYGKISYVREFVRKVHAYART